MSASSEPQFNLLVSGDVVVDHHIYEGLRRAPTTERRRGVRDVRELGGAAILVELLKAALASADDASWNVALGVATPRPDENPCGHHAYAVWTPFARERTEDGRDKVWRASLPMGYGHADTIEPDRARSAEACKPFEAKALADLPRARILVLDDAGSFFREPAQKESWLLPSEPSADPDWIVLKMAGPVAQGDLWQELAGRFADRLVCIVAADELRAECVNISRGLSWERAVEEVREALLDSPALKPLTKCRHLIVWFFDDGALWLDQTDQTHPRAKLVFDARGAEGEWRARSEGWVFGHSMAMTSAIAFGLTRGLDEKGRPALAEAIHRGLAALRDLIESGHGRVGDEPPPGFPVARLAPIIANSKQRFAQADVPWPAGGEALARSDHPWMIAESSQRPPELKTFPPLVGLARQYVLQGPKAFGAFPSAKFGKLDTIDRNEIETLRSLRRMMIAYDQQRRPSQPLSFGVFGPPGAGKSFGVKQIAEEVFGPQAWLEFNLSQFNGAPDLIGAFHQVRDKALSGVTPVAFWDEFDSDSYKWLKDLLAPMQDGRFQEGQVSHWIGKCVFIFAGGTSATYKEFGPAEGADDDAKLQFTLRKGPDFHSRLDAFYNVIGPNPRELPPPKETPAGPRRPDPADVCFPLRRALMIRSTLGCARDARLDFDSDLLDALLLVPKYKHGARSLQKMVSSLRPHDGVTIRRSALPPPALIDMHVDGAAFDRLLKRNKGFRASELIEALAAVIHERYLATSRANETKIEPNFDKPYDALAPVDKEPNRDAARRIPRILALVGAGLEKSGEPLSTGEASAGEIRAYLEFHVERLAEEEHIGWTEERFAGGWRYGAPRDNARKLHPLLVDYAKLPSEQKAKDRDAIRNIPEIAAKAGYRIVWLRA
jgi:hypothetical protein